jgi:prepilin-type N-terminal cleavage/methylation domain-containing protein
MHPRDTAAEKSHSKLSGWTRFDGFMRGTTAGNGCLCAKKEGSSPVIANKQGFTLVELLIGMTLSVIAMALVYSGYRSQQQAHTNERLVVDMQQNGRSTLAFMRREIRMANYAPRAVNGIDDDGDASIDEADESVVNGFQTVRADRLNFTMDINNNANTYVDDGDDLDNNENITYRFNAADDADGDGIADAGSAVLRREGRAGAGLQPLAFDVHAVAFAYAFDVDNDGALDTYPGVPNGVVIWAFDSDGDGTLDRHLDTNMDGLIDEDDTAGGANLAPTVAMNEVRAVQIWLLSRSQVPMKGHAAVAQSYVVGPRHITVNDGFKRCLFNSMITVRNPL